MRTTVGRDWQALIMANAADSLGSGSVGTGDYAPANYMALSANTDPESAGSTSLPGEIGGGTLARVQAAAAFTDGASSYTLTNIFTSDQTVDIAKVGIFNAVTTGVLVFEKLLDDVAALISGDQVAITATVNL